MSTSSSSSGLDIPIDQQATYRTEASLVASGGGGNDNADLISDLQGKLERATEKRQETEERAGRLEQELNQLEQEYQKSNKVAQATIDALKEELTRSVAEQEQLNTKAGRLEREVDRYKKELAESMAVIQDLERRLQDAQADGPKLNVEVDNDRETVAMLRQSVQERDRVIEQLKEELAQNVSAQEIKEAAQLEVQLIKGDAKTRVDDKLVEELRRQNRALEERLLTKDDDKTLLNEARERARLATYFCAKLLVLHGVSS